MIVYRLPPAPSSSISLPANWSTNDLPAGGCERRNYRVPLGRVVDRIEADDAEPLTQRHHHDVGVIDRHALAGQRLESVECHWREVELAAERGEKIGVGAARQAAIRLAVDAVEHHGPRAFEEAAFLFVPRIVAHRQAIAAACGNEAAKEFHALGTTVWREHRTQHERVVLERDTALNSPRAECDRAPTRGVDTPAPDAVVEIEKVDVGMSCVFGQQEYWVAVQWRTVTSQSRRVLNWSTTRCTAISTRTVDDWFANPDQARLEVEWVLAKTGQRMASELLSHDQIPFECRLRSDEAGEMEVK